MRFLSFFLLLIWFSDLFGQSLQTTSEFIYEKAPFESCHASTIAETPAGLVVAWFGGPYEKHPDVGIWISRKSRNQTWTTPEEVANGIQHTDKRYPCWNPVLFYHPEAGLILFFKVGPSPSEWWGEMMVSSDFGVTWSSPRRLPEDILGPVKNKPELLVDNVLLCASSTEHDGWKVHVELTSDWGNSWKKTDIPASSEEMQAIQPTILKHEQGKLQMLCRSRNNVILQTWSTDNGLTWSPLQPASLPNPNSGIDAVSVNPNSHWLLYNPTKTPEGEWGGDRYPLVLAHSKDGISWENKIVLEDLPGEYSYPSIVYNGKGKLHLVYTWKREKIKYWEIRVNE